MLSKCSLALMRNVAMEFVRISALFMVILSALSLFSDAWHKSLFNSLSSPLFGVNLSPVTNVLELGGDRDDDAGDNVEETNRRLPDEETRKFCDGDVERFCGDPNGANCPFGSLADEDEEGGGGIGWCDICGGGWFGGVRRCSVNAPLEWCGEDKRILCGDIEVIPWGEIRKPCGLPWWAKPKLVIAILDGVKLSGGVK